MAFPKKVSDDVVKASYMRTRSVHQTAVEVGLNHSSVHERVVKLGIGNVVNRFTDEDKQVLREKYHRYAQTGNLDVLAAHLGRTKSFICRAAKELGLTDQKREKPYAAKWKTMSEPEARKMMDRFKESSLTLKRYCRHFKIGEIGFWQTMKKYFPDEWEHVIESKQPTTTKYRLGRAFEYRTRDILKKKGYFVMRSPASRSPIDLVAIKPGVVLFVQCKVGGALGVGEWNELFDLAKSVDATPILSYRDGKAKTEFRKIIGRKDGSRKQQPFEEFNP